MDRTVAERIERMRTVLTPGTALLIEDEENRTYLTGFPASDGWLLILPDAAVLWMDSRYVEKARASVTVCPVERVDGPVTAPIAECLRRHGCQRLLVGAERTGVSRLQRLRERLAGVTVEADEAVDRRLEELRAVKSPYELDCIRRAQRLTDDTFSYILERIEVGRTERDVMLDMEFWMRRHGSEGVAFDFIVVSGKNSSLPHGVPTDKPIERGDFVTMDFGAVVGGYRSDMTRTVAVGTVSEEQRRVYDTVLNAQTAALAAIRAGERCDAIDRIARDAIDAAGYAGCFGHGLGHAVGLEIHESPAFSPRCDAVLRPGMVMTVEPGIYLEGRFGVRIEDMVAVTAAGCENLTASDKQLLVL